MTGTIIATYKYKDRGIFFSSSLRNKVQWTKRKYLRSNSCITRLTHDPLHFISQRKQKQNYTSILKYLRTTVNTTVNQNVNKRQSNITFISCYCFAIKIITTKYNSLFSTYLGCSTFPNIPI